MLLVHKQNFILFALSIPLLSFDSAVSMTPLGLDSAMFSAVLIANISANFSLFAKICYGVNLWPRRMFDEKKRVWKIW
jgi:hypothetical protein